MVKPIRIIAAGALVAFLTQSAAADTISFADAIHELMGACTKDVTKYCSDVRLGSGRIEACINDHASQITPQCTTTFAQVQVELQARAEAQAAAPQICAGDAKRLCRNFREGKARILNCLLRPDNANKVTKRCNQAITAAGWR